MSPLSLRWEKDPRYFSVIKSAGVPNALTRQAVTTTF